MSGRLKGLPDIVYAWQEPVFQQECNYGCLHNYAFYVSCHKTETKIICPFGVFNKKKFIFVTFLLCVELRKRRNGKLFIYYII